MESETTRAQESSAAIERIYIAMRHLFNSGGYKPMGISGETLRKSLITLSPEIYGSIADPEKVELDGLLYVMERLPKGIEECRNIRLVSREGLENSNFKVIIPPKRVRNCFRVDEEQMFIEMTRGRSDIYDILTHLTFVYNEAEKIRKNSLDRQGRLKRDWNRLEEIVQKEGSRKKFSFESLLAKSKIHNNQNGFRFLYKTFVKFYFFRDISGIDPDHIHDLHIQICTACIINLLKAIF